MELTGQITEMGKNFIFLGEAGSGKSEIAVNIACRLAKQGEKQVHFFDMDMTKPLFRSRELKSQLEEQGIVCHYEEQFMDAPTLTGGVSRLMKDDTCYVVMDVGGDSIGARSIGGFAPMMNRENTVVYYILNAYRPWSGNIDQVDQMLGSILGVSHIKLKQIHLVNNPSRGCGTTAEEFLAGKRRMEEMVSPYHSIDFTCVRRDLYEEIRSMSEEPVLPIDLYLTYPWNQTLHWEGV